MKIERYIARDTRTAMAQVRAELGPDAMILANRRMGDRVEITAAVNIDEWVERQNTEPRDVAARSATTPAAGVAQSAAQSAVPTNEIQLKALEKELHRLRGMLESELGDRQWRDSAGLRSPLNALRQRLLRMGLSRTLTAQLMQGMEQQAAGRRLDTAWQQALQTLLSRIAVRGPAAPGPQAPAQQITALFGSTGVGKTSSIAKLAGRDVQHLGAERVGLITLDSYRMGAREQLASFADAVGLPLLAAQDRHGLSLALREMRGRRIYIDTAGMAQHDPRLQEQLELVREVGVPVECLLVLSASAQPAQSRAVSTLLAGRGIGGAVITKVDEALSLGGVIDVLIRANLALHSFADGQRVPEDLHVADARALVTRAAELLGQDSERENPARPAAWRASA